MKHGYFGRKLGRNKDERKQLFRNLSRELIMHGRIHTTFAKAKSIQPMVEKLITQVKKATNGALREAHKTLSDRIALTTLTDMTKTRFGSRTSGYTRVVKLGTRKGDASEMVYLEFVDAAPVKEAVNVPKTTKVSKKVPAVVEAEVVQEEKPKQKAKVKKTTTK